MRYSNLADAGPNAAGIALVVVAAVAIAAFLVIPVVQGVLRRRRPPPMSRRPRGTSWATPDTAAAERPAPPDERDGSPDIVEPVEPAEMPRDGRRRTAHELPGFGNLHERPKRHGA
ncbi:DUF6479 family protein [Yinghuangia aomiensis]